MSLKVWLSGDYKNRGSANVSVANNGTTLDNDRNSYVFNGSNSYISTVCTDYPTIFSGDFSIAFWTYSNDDGSRSVYIGNYGLSGSGNWFNLEKYSNDVIRIWWHDGSPDIRATTTIKAADGWVHICITRTGNTFKIFKNGVLSQTISNYTISNDIPSTATTFYIGTDFRTSSDIVLKGKLADFRIYDEAISPELIRHLSRQPHEKELKVWLPLNGDLRNQGTADVTVTNNGATVDNSGKMGKCYYLNANKLSFTNPKVGDWNKFTVCGWVKLADGYTANNGFHLFIFGATYYRICISKDGAAVRVLLSDGSTNSGGSSTMSASALSAAIWNHYAVSFDNGKVSIYINGILDNSYTVSFTSVRFANATLDIGTYSSETCKGSIDDFRLYSYALSPEEIKRISQGLALHYRLSGIGVENLLKQTNTGKSYWSWSGNGGTRTAESFLDGSVKLSAVTDANAGTWSVIQYNDINLKTILEAGTIYTASVDVYSPITTNGFRFSIRDGNGLNVIGVATVDCQIKENQWNHCVWTFTTENNFTISNQIIYITGIPIETGRVIYLKNLKLEKGSKATSWLPNPADSLYSTMGLDNDIEYDISGFNNNGTKSPVVIVNTDSPRYETSYETSSNSYFVNGGKISNILCQETPEYTVNLWCYKDDWTDNASELFSCAEGGGFAFDTTTSGFRTWSNVYTNADKTSYSYIAYTQTHTLSSGWHMFTLVDDLTGTKAYIDGELIRTAPTANYGLHLNVNANLYIGAESTGGSYTSPYLNGRVSDFRIYTTALSVSDVQALYNLGEV